MRLTDRAPLRPYELFLGFAQLGLVSFGGAITMARRLLVEKLQWLEPAEFNEVVGLGQILPGPNVVNASVVIGAREAGPLGALAALAGILLPPLGVVLVLATMLEHAGNAALVQRVLHGSALAGAGIIVATGLRMASRLRANGLEIFLAVCALGLFAIVRWPLPLIIAVLVPLGVALVLLGRRPA